MGPAIGETLPLALGIAISPVPIIAAILLLDSPRARGSGIGFLAGWALGIAIAVIVFTIISTLLPEPSEGPNPLAGALNVIFGAGLLLLSRRQWRASRAPSPQTPPPKWMSAIKATTTVGGLLLGLGLSTVNPKNLLLAASAGVVLGSGGLQVWQGVVAIAVFTALASLSVAVPVVGYLVLAEKMRAPLESLRNWLVTYNSAVMGVLLLVIGVVLIGKGIARF